jgi:hypothetical protein
MLNYNPFGSARRPRREDDITGIDERHSRLLRRQRRFRQAVKLFKEALEKDCFGRRE